MSTQNLCIHVSMYYEIILCMQRKTKELISLHNRTADLRFCFSLNQTTGFRVYLKTRPYNASYIKICKNINVFAVDFQCLRSNCGSVVC